MDSDRVPAGLEQVLQHERGLRRLAAALLSNPADADDAVQHALTQAALGRRQPGVPLWPFLRTVLRRRASNLRKLAARRRIHEQLAARGEAVPSAAEFAAREQLRRRVADAVQGLAEPYRTTVWLRWFEDLAAAAVAERMRVPLTTVRTRLQRAHAQLAARLDREYGDRGSWAVLALPFARGATLAAVTAISSGLAMKKILAATLVLLPLALGYLMWPGPGDVAVTNVGQASPPDMVTAQLPIDNGTRQQVDVPTPAVPRPLLSVQFADGSPARNLPVWFWRDDASRPLWTNRVDAERDREAGPGQVNASEEPIPPAPSAETDAHGRVALPEEAAQAAIVSVRFAPEQEFSAPLPAKGKPFVLPVLGEVEIGLGAAPPGSKWSVLVTAAMREPDGGHSEYGDLRVNVDSPIGPGVVRIREHRFDLDVADRLHALLPRGQLCRVEAIGHGLDLRLVTNGEHEAIVNAPTVLEAECRRRLPGLEVTVIDAGKGRTSMAGHCNLLDHHGYTEDDPGAPSPWFEQRKELEGGMVTIDEVELQKGAIYSLTVLMADGEWFERDVPFAPVNGVQQLMLTRGEGRQPIRLRTPGVAADSVHEVAIESADGSIHYAETLANYYTASIPVFVTSGDRVAISMLPDDWRAAWVVLANGRIGAADHRADGDVADVHWLPATSSDPIDVAALFGEYGDHEMMAAYLQVGVVGSRGTEFWFTLATYRRFHKNARVAPPVWRDLQLPTDSHSRIELYASDDPEAVAGETRDIPLPRR